MTQLLLGPMTVSTDEACYLLEERVEPAKAGYHRFQVLTVVRNDKNNIARLVKCKVDLGPEKNFTAPLFNLIGGVREYKMETCAVCLGKGNLPDPNGVPWFPKACEPCRGSGQVETGRIEILESVGSLRDQADMRRAGLVEHPHYEVSDLKKEWRDQADQKRRARRGLVTFGNLHLEKRVAWS